MSLTLSKAIDIVLRRTGQSISNGDYRNHGRDYLSLALSEVVNDGTRWRWLDITGTFTTTSGTRRYTPVATNVASWENFVDQTNGRPLDIVSSNDYDSIDPEHDDSGTVEKVYVSGISSTDNENEIYLWRTPSNSSTVIRYRYFRDVGAWTDSDDSSTLLQLGIPRIVEKAIIHQATAMYCEEKGDFQKAEMESHRFARAYTAAQAHNGAQVGNRLFLPIRNRTGGDEFTISVGTEQVTAA